MQQTPASSRRTFVLRTASVLALVLVLLTGGFASAKGVPEPADRSVIGAESPYTLYEGQALDAVGAPSPERCPLTVRYLDASDQLLLTETHPSIVVENGRFEARLGAGEIEDDSSFDSVEALFAAHPQLEIEIVVGGTTYEPRQTVLPKGHSLKTHLIAAGLHAEDDDQQHWKHYEIASAATAIQSAVLAPKGTRPQPPAEGNVWRRPFTLPVIGPGLSQRVADLPPAVQKPFVDNGAEVNRPRHEALFDENGNRFGTMAPKVDDYLAGPAAISSANRTPGLNQQFAGIGNVTGVLPPDTEGAVGPNHYVHVVNSAFAVFNKTGTQLTSTANTNTLWSGFGGPCQNNNSGDAIFLYDEAADRFVLTQFAVAGGNQSVCWAISQTGDPTGAYYLYEVVTPRFPDYYKVGVWPAANNNAYFFGTNSGFQGAYDVFAVDRANMLTGSTARPMQFFQSFPNLLMPADVDGPVGPGANRPGTFYTIRDGGESYFGNPATDSIDIYEFDVDWNTPSNSTFTLTNVITPAQGLANFNWTVCGFFVSNCLPQPGTGQGIDSASWWPMQRLVYRNFGSHETLVGTWTVDVNSTGNRAAPRWFELRDVGSGWSIFQQGTHSPDSIHRWMGSIAMDGSGNIALGYSRGDGSNFPSIYYTVREAGDPLGTMQAEALLFAGSGSQTSSSSRWGDYSSMELDPADDCTFWYTTEYLATTSNANWLTRIGSFTIPGCGGPANDPPTVNITAPANGATFTVGDSVAFSGTATDTEDGTLTGSLSWSSSIDGSIGSGGSFSTTGLSVGSPHHHRLGDGLGRRFGFGSDLDHGVLAGRRTLPDLHQLEHHRHGLVRDSGHRGQRHGRGSGRDALPPGQHLAPDDADLRHHRRHGGGVRVPVDLAGRDPRHRIRRGQHALEQPDLQSPRYPELRHHGLRQLHRLELRDLPDSGRPVLHG